MFLFSLKNKLFSQGFSHDRSENSACNENADFPDVMIFDVSLDGTLQSISTSTLLLFNEKKKLKAINWLIHFNDRISVTTCNSNVTETNEIITLSSSCI